MTGVYVYILHEEAGYLEVVVRHLAKSWFAVGVRTDFFFKDGLFCPIFGLLFLRNKVRDGFTIHNLAGFNLRLVVID